MEGRDNAGKRRRGTKKKRQQRKGKEETRGTRHEAQGAHRSKAYHYMYSCELVKFLSHYNGPSGCSGEAGEVARRMTEHYVIVRAVQFTA